MMKANDEIKKGMDEFDDEFFFAPFDHIKCIEEIIANLEITRRELQKVAEGMSRVES